MGARVLDKKLLDKLSKKTGKSKKYIQEQVSKRASRNAIASETALIIWAKSVGIGVATYLRKLSPHIQNQVETHNGSMTAQQPINGKTVSKATKALSERQTIRKLLKYFIEDRELAARCNDLLTAPRHYDRAVREATIVLDSRLKKKGNIKIQMNPVDVVGKVLNPDPLKAIVTVSDEKYQQEGIYSICKGLMLLVRNQALDLTRFDGHTKG